MKHRGIVVVHGVGESPKGDYLDSFVEPFANFVADAIGSKSVTMIARNEPGSSTTWATLSLCDADTGETEEEWHIREAWWAQSFSASGAQSVLGWAIVAGISIFVATWRNIFWRNLLRALGPGSYERTPGARIDLHGRPLKDASPPQRLGEEAEKIWTVAGASRFKALLDALIWALICVVYLVAAVIGLVIIVPLYLFLLTPLTAVLPAVAGTIQRKILGVLVRSIGDQQAMTTRRFALAAAADEVSKALWPMLSPDGVAKTKHHDGTYGYETVTIVSHSGGAVVAFDALAGEVKGWMHEAMEPIPGSSVPMKRPARVNWVTAGSGLNLAFRMRRKDDDHDKAFWERPVHSFVNWVNIYARYDPVPQGPAPVGLVDQLVGKDPWLTEPTMATRRGDDGELLARPPYVCLRVVNTDFPGSDHFGYWENKEEVLSRVAQLVMSDKLATDRISPQDVEVAPSGLPKLSTKVGEQAASGRPHRWRVLRQTGPVYLGMIAFLVGLYWAKAIGGAISGLDIHIGTKSLDAILLGGVADWTAVYRDFALGALVLAFVGLTLSQLLGLVASLRSWLGAGGAPVGE